MQLQADQCSPQDRHKRIQSGNHSRPIPPLLGNGEAVDLLKLFVHVKKRGGYDAISRDGLWEKVCEDQGLQFSGLSSAIKLIYYKYFLSLGKDSTNISAAVDLGEADYGDLGLNEADFLCFAAKRTKEKKKNQEGSQEGSTDGDNLCNVKKDWISEEVQVIEVLSDSSDSSNNQTASVDNEVCKPDRAKNVFKGARVSADVETVGKERMFEDSSATKDASRGDRKRKRECVSSNMLAWLNSVGKDPANPAIGTLPESSNWKSYGNDHCWKQVLLIRAALFNKMPEDISPEQFPWQKKQKMHPSMFDKADESAEKVRSSPRLHFTGFLGTTNNHISSLSSFNLRKRIPVGKCFQAVVPEWTGVAAESDPKWLGTRIWPSKEKSLAFVLEEDKNQVKITRNSANGRESPGSFEFIRSQICRRRMKLKVELGDAFYSWKFDKMGEEARTYWTNKDSKKFEVVVRENPLSQGKRFWDKVLKIFPSKSRQDLVSYYYNVFLLQRRARQNRYSPSNIDSDDDEMELIAKSSSSILSPGKKIDVD